MAMANTSEGTEMAKENIMVTKEDIRQSNQNGILKTNQNVEITKERGRIANVVASIERRVSFICSIGSDVDTNMGNNDIQIMAKQDTTVAKANTSIANQGAQVVAKSDSKMGKANPTIAKSDLKVAKSDLNVAKSDSNITKADTQMIMQDTKLANSVTTKQDTARERVDTTTVKRGSRFSITMHKGKYSTDVEKEHIFSANDSEITLETLRNYNTQENTQVTEVGSTGGSKGGSKRGSKGSDRSKCSTIYYTPKSSMVDSNEYFEFTYTTVASFDEAFDSLSDDNKDKCEITGFTNREKKMIWASCKEITRDHRERRRFGIELFQWLLENVPHMSDHFAYGDKHGDDLLLAQVFLSHSETIFDSLYRFVVLLPFPERMLEKMTKVALSHLSRKEPYKVGTDYFEIVHVNFHKFISVYMKKEVNSKIVKLWVGLIGILCRVVEDEEKKENPLNERRGSTAYRNKSDVNKRRLCCNCL